MSWISDIVHRAGQPFRNFLDSIRGDVYEYCDYLMEQGATIDEVHAVAMGYYEVIAAGNMLQYLYLKYVDDWADDRDVVDTK